MEMTQAMDALQALSQETRLKAFRLLLRNLPDGLPAGEIAKQIGARQNTVSTHLGHLVRAGLAGKQRRSRQIIYRAELAGIEALVTFLTHDCCKQNPEVCQTLIKNWTDPLSDKPQE